MPNTSDLLSKVQQANLYFANLMNEYVDSFVYSMERDERINTKVNNLYELLEAMGYQLAKGLYYDNENTKLIYQKIDCVTPIYNTEITIDVTLIKPFISNTIQSQAVWGGITGDINNQQDLIGLLSLKQNNITLTTTGASGAATLIGATLNIPNYGSALSGYVPYTGATGAVNLGAFDLTVNGVKIGRGGGNLSSNTRFGNNSLPINTTGVNNTAIGFSVLSNNIIGASNTGIGHQALANSNSNDNTAVGLSSLFSLLTGNNNISFGSESGWKISGGADLTIANNSIFLGYATKALANNQTNQIVIGYDATGNGSNTVTIGNSSITNNYFTGNIRGGAFIKSGGISSEFLKADGSIDSNAYITSAALSGYVPYTGANADVDLGIYDFSAGSVTIQGSSPTAGSYLGFKHSTNVITGANGFTSMYTFGTNIIGYKSINGASTKDFSFNMQDITPNVSGGRVYVLPDASGTLALVGGAGVGTVTSVAALTLGTTGTDLSSTVANGTTTPVITLNVPTASATNRGALSSADWSVFNGKQAAGNYITSLTGEATASGPGAASVTLDNTAVTGKLLTGLNITGGTVVSTDSILTALGKVQNQINGLIGGSIFQGVWDASTNNPALASSVGTNGYYYIVSVAGSTNLNGITDWKVGDWAIFAGTTWQKVDNTDAVSSVNGYTGTVSLVTGDVLEGAGSLPGRPSQLYFTDARARAAISLTTTGSSGAATYDNGTGVLNIPNYGSALTGYVTLDTAQTITAAKTFSTSGGSDTLIINHSSGSGIALNITKGGNGEGIYVNKTSGTGNAVTIVGTLNATTLVKNGGTSSQFLKADGSIDSNFYALSSSLNNYLPTQGGTLTGALTGTSATFSGNINATNASATVNIIATGINSGTNGGSSLIAGTTGVTNIAIGNKSAILGGAFDSTSMIYWGNSGNLILNNGADRLILTSSGNLGLGVTPSAWGIYKAYQVGWGSIASYDGSDTAIFSNTYFDGGNWRYIGTGNASQYRQLNSVHSWLTAPSGTAGNTISFTQAMTLDASGRLGIGTTSPDQKLTVEGNIRAGGVGNGFLLDTTGVNFTNGMKVVNSFETVMFSGRGSAGYIIAGDNNLRFGFGTNYSAGESMRITSGGNVGIGTTSPASILDIRSANIPRIQLVKTGILSWFLGDTQQDGTNLFSIGTDSGSNFRILNINNSGNVCIGRTATFGSERVSIESTSSNPIITTYNFNATAVTHHEIRNQNGIVGTIVAIGGGTVYNTLSDYRVKEDLKEINGLEKLLKLKVYNFKWKWNNERTDGVLAHELQEIIPYAVHGEKDNEQMQQVDYSKLVPVLVKAIQELSEKVKQLENK
jgi:hypothetical protein